MEYRKDIKNGCQIHILMQTQRQNWKGSER